MNAQPDPGGFQPASPYSAPPAIKEIAAELETPETRVHPDAETVRRLIRYDPETGKMFWNDREPSQFDTDPKSARKASNSFYVKHAEREITRRHIRLDDYTEHKRGRIAWMHHYGEVPAGGVYHLNRDPDDCRIANLTLKRPRRQSAPRPVAVADPSPAKPAKPATPARRADRNKKGAKHDAPVDAEVARDLLRYDPQKSGEVLFWRERGREYFKTDGECSRWNKMYAGKPAEKLHENGRTRVKIFGKLYYADLLVWAIHHGELPEHVEHLNGRSNNLLENLRAVSKEENEQRKIAKSETGIPGVSIRYNKYGERSFVVSANTATGRRSRVFQTIGEAASYKQSEDRYRMLIEERERNMPAASVRSADEEREYQRERQQYFNAQRDQSMPPPAPPRKVRAKGAGVPTG